MWGGGAGFCLSTRYENTEFVKVCWRTEPKTGFIRALIPTKIMPVDTESHFMFICTRFRMVPKLKTQKLIYIRDCEAPWVVASTLDSGGRPARN